MNDLQKKELEILVELIKVFDKNKLEYFALAGTCIGAVRHNGFIPWDDDIDIVMPRDDYELFRTLYYKKLPGKYMIIDGSISKAYSLLWLKVFDSETTYIEKSVCDFPDAYTGVFVDIFPYDFLPRRAKEREKVRKKFRILRKLNYLVRPNYVLPQNPNLKGYVKYYVKKIMGKFFSYNYFNERLRILACEQDFVNAEDVYFTFTNEKNSKKICKKDWFSSYIIFDFETIKIHVPNGYDKMLTLFYGDYMKFPPIEERLNSGHPFEICDLNISYKHYAELKMKRKS